jgi:hypothetical protein
MYSLTSLQLLTWIFPNSGIQCNNYLWMKKNNNFNFKLRLQLPQIIYTYTEKLNTTASKSAPPPTLTAYISRFIGRVQLKCDGTQWCTGGEIKGEVANGVGSQYSHTTSEHGVSSTTKAYAHILAASSRLNWRLCRFKRTRPFRWKTKSGFCACAITFQT